jgi:hypothetical protein
MSIKRFVLMTAMAAALAPVAYTMAQATPTRGTADDAPATSLPPTRSGMRGTSRGGTTDPTLPPTTPAATSPVTRSGSRGMSASATPPVPGHGPTCTLDAIIYDVRLPADQISKINLEALTQSAANTLNFEKALAALGTAKPLYRANQSVRLSGDTIIIGVQMPYITNSQVTSTGQTISSVSYSQVGAIFNIAGQTGATPSNFNLDLGMQVSSMTEGPTLISTNVHAPMFRTATMTHKGPVEAKRPFIVVSIDAAAIDADGKAMAYIARINMGTPQQDSGDK